MQHCRNSCKNRKLHSWHIHRTQRILNDGGVIAYSTEAVMGLGCDPWSGAAVAKVLQLKRRPVEKGLIIIAAAMEQLTELVDFSGIPNLDEITGSWPGPVTWLAPALPDTPRWLIGRHNTLAVRVSAHPVVRQLCEQVGPLVSTSANPSGCHPARTLRRVRAYFGQDVDCYIPGKVGGDPRPSVIRHAISGRVLRA